MINVGMVGLGFMGVTHLKAYAKVQGARIAAVCDAIKLPNADGTLGGVAGNIGTDRTSTGARPVRTTLQRVGTNR